jgi:hypothetical protein
MHKYDDVFPNTFIIGAAKAGTTSLFHLLRQHPQVFFAFDKEPKFFSDDEIFSRGVDWYCHTYFAKSAKFPIRAEATPHYLYWADKVAPRIKTAVADRPAKFIAILRNPIDRAHSWYWNMVVDGRESLPFADAIQAEESRLQENWSQLYPSGSMTYGYVRGGRYATQLNRYFDLFPKDQFHILLLEDLQKDQEKTVNDLLLFLGIDPNSELTIKQQNPSQKPRNKLLHSWIRNQSRVKKLFKGFFPLKLRYRLRSTILESNLMDFNYPPMEKSDYSYLAEQFLPEIDQLSKMLDRDLSSWLRSASNP